MVLMLVSTGEPKVQVRLPLESTVKVGRDPSCELLLSSDLSVSRKHATITISKNVVMVTDASSMGTFFNGAKQQKGVAFKLAVNDRVRFGSLKSEFMLTNVPIRICLSGLSDVEKKKLKTEAIRLGFEVLADVTFETTHLIIPHRDWVTSFKLTKALQYGKEVITPNWLYAISSCPISQGFPNCDEFRPSAMNNATRSRIESVAAQSQAIMSDEPEADFSVISERAKLFSDIRAFVIPSGHEAALKEERLLLTNGGAAKFISSSDLEALKVYQNNNSAVLVCPNASVSNFRQQAPQHLLSLPAIDKKHIGMAVLTAKRLVPVPPSAIPVPELANMKLKDSVESAKIKDPHNYPPQRRMATIVLPAETEATAKAQTGETAVERTPAKAKDNALPETVPFSKQKTKVTETSDRAETPMIAKSGKVDTSKPLESNQNKEISGESLGDIKVPGAAMLVADHNSHSTERKVESGGKLAEVDMIRMTTVIPNQRETEMFSTFSAVTPFSSAKRSEAASGSRESASDMDEPLSSRPRVPMYFESQALAHTFADVRKSDELSRTNSIKQTKPIPLSVAFSKKSDTAKKPAAKKPSDEKPGLKVELPKIGFEDGDENRIQVRELITVSNEQNRYNESKSPYLKNANTILDLPKDGGWLRKPMASGTSEDAETKMEEDLAPVIEVVDEDEIRVCQKAPVQTAVMQQQKRKSNAVVDFKRFAKNKVPGQDQMRTIHKEIEVSVEGGAAMSEKMSVLNAEEAKMLQAFGELLDLPIKKGSGAPVQSTMKDFTKSTKKPQSRKARKRTADTSSESFNDDDEEEELDEVSSIDTESSDSVEEVFGFKVSPNPEQKKDIKVNSASTSSGKKLPPAVAVVVPAKRTAIAASLPDLKPSKKITASVDKDDEIEEIDVEPTKPKATAAKSNVSNVVSKPALKLGARGSGRKKLL